MNYEKIFSNTVVAMWNSLPNSAGFAESVNRLDKLWMMHDFVYDYRADPLAAGSNK